MGQIHLVFFLVISNLSNDLDGELKIGIFGDSRDDLSLLTTIIIK